VTAFPPPLDIVSRPLFSFTLATQALSAQVMFEASNKMMSTSP